MSLLLFCLVSFCFLFVPFCLFGFSFFVAFLLTVSPSFSFFFEANVLTSFLEENIAPFSHRTTCLFCSVLSRRLLSSSCCFLCVVVCLFLSSLVVFGSFVLFLFVGLCPSFVFVWFVSVLFVLFVPSFVCLVLSSVFVCLSFVVVVSVCP